MSYLLEILRQSPDQLDAGQKVLLATVILGCIALVVRSVHRLVHCERRLQAIDSELSRLTKESSAS